MGITDPLILSSFCSSFTTNPSKRYLRIHLYVTCIELQLVTLRKGIKPKDTSQSDNQGQHSTRASLPQTAKRMLLQLQHVKGLQCYPNLASNNIPSKYMSGMYSEPTKQCSPASCPSFPEQEEDRQGMLSQNLHNHGHPNVVMESNLPHNINTDQPQINQTGLSQSGLYTCLNSTLHSTQVHTCMMQVHIHQRTCVHGCRAYHYTAHTLVRSSPGYASLQIGLLGKQSQSTPCNVKWPLCCPSQFDLHFITWATQITRKPLCTRHITSIISPSSSNERKIICFSLHSRIVQ